MHWNEPTKPENLLAIIRTVVGDEAEAKKVVGAAASDEVKKRLTENTQAAFGDGAFGVPWFVGESMFPFVDVEVSVVMVEEKSSV